MKKGDKVICIDNAYSKGLFTVGKVYTVLDVNSTDYFREYISIVCDDNIVHDEYTFRFIELKVSRRDKLERIGLSS